MNNAGNTRKTVKLFCAIVFSLLFLWLLAARGLKLKGALSSSAEYQDRIAALGPVDKTRLAELAAYLDSLRESPPRLQSPDFGESSDSNESGPETGIETIRELLRAAGIRGERLRFGGKEGDGLAELTLRCETVKFFEFLAELSGRGRRPVNYLSIRAVPGSRESDIVMRFKYE
ncbi:MAG: hypothetical protein LBE17_09750 [Treponema sp.]|jgi:hypothetical protein|nr:hypothetical protein [Treponema sp.]